MHEQRAPKARWVSGRVVDYTMINFANRRVPSHRNLAASDNLHMPELEMVISGPRRKSFRWRARRAMT